jgi:hypothetical protein
MAPHRGHDPRKELLSIFGVIAVAAGLLLTLLLAHITQPMEPSGPTVLFLMAIILAVAGAWLTTRRRWAGMVIAAMSLAAAAAYLIMLTRCRTCSFGVLIANISLAVLYGMPGALIIRWRRFLR